MMMDLGQRGLLQEFGYEFPLDAYVVSCLWLGKTVVFALGDGTLRFADSGSNQMQAVTAHDGVVLAMTRHPDGRSVVSGGDDGRLIHTGPGRKAHALASFTGRWVEHVVASPASGAIVCAVGRDAYVLPRGAQEINHQFSHPNSIGGLAFSPKGLRLAASHYGGVSLWQVLDAERPKKSLAWRGSHLAVTWSPDGRHVLTALQENALHGWRLADGVDMQMSGYPTKTHSLSWSVKGAELATSGAGTVICWPFTDPDGPMGKTPLELGMPVELVTCVACHPRDRVLAAGYADGAVLLLLLDDPGQVLVREATGSSVTALSWSKNGLGLAFGTQDGHAGWLIISGKKPR